MNPHDISRQDYLDFPDIQTAVASGKFDLIQAKYDGIWCLLHVVGGQGVWYSRTHQVKHSAQTTLEDGLYAGEYMFGQQWALHPSRYGKTYLFDLLWSGNRDYRGFAYLDRWRELSDRLQRASDPNLLPVSNVSVSLAEPFWARILANDFEGVVLRRSSADYNTPLGRVKRKVQGDYIALDVIEGRGKHAGRLGAIRLGVFSPNGPTPLFEVGGGFSDAERDDIWRTWPRDKFRVCTVEGRARFETGALRHPNFVCWRDDKTMEECK